MSLPLATEARPLTRGDCLDAPRPCSWSSCRYHLGADAPWTCCLDVADFAAAGGTVDQDDAARLLGMSRQAVGHTEVMAFRALRAWATPLRRERGRAVRPRPLADRVFTLLASVDCGVPMAEIAERCGVSVRGAKKVLTELRRRGVVTLTKLGGDASWQLAEAA